eukprot:Hpha_TRINITY_DN7782_c0_g1::TRINITY_DN7782_c0_g1_i1::g.85454::m.85454
MSFALPLLAAGGHFGCKFSSVSSGYKHTCGIAEPGGTVWCWGGNAYGSLGSGDMVSRGNTLNSMATLSPVPVAASDGDNKVQRLALGDFTCAVVGSAGELKCWGRNNHGQLGTGDTINRGVNPGEVAGLTPLPIPASCLPMGQVVAGRKHLCVLCANNIHLYCLGDNIRGELGLGNNLARGGAPGWTVGWTPTDLGGVVVKKLLASSAAHHTCAISAGGMMKCWGNGLDGALGYGTTISMGDSPGEIGGSLPYVNLKGNSALEGCVGYRMTCVVYTTLKVECWGLQEFGVLGNHQNTSSKNAPTGVTVDLSALGGEGVGSISCGKRHVCALSQSGSYLVCWGKNEHGQLGYGDTLNRGGPLDFPWNGMGSLTAVRVGNTTTQSKKIMEVSCGLHHTCVRLEDGVLMCWGDALQGQIGSDGTTDLGMAYNDMEQLQPILPVNCPTEGPSVG